MGINRMTIEICHIPCHFSLSGPSSIVRFVRLQMHIYHQEKLLQRWNSLKVLQTLCNLARGLEVSTSRFSWAIMDNRYEYEAHYDLSLFTLPHSSCIIVNYSWAWPARRVWKQRNASSALRPPPHIVFTSLDLALNSKSQYYCWFSYATFENNKSFN